LQAAVAAKSVVAVQVVCFILLHKVLVLTKIL
jgi:hypothetical protein